MPTLPFSKLHFNKDGVPLRVETELIPDGTTDILVLGHGWKNGVTDADRLYTSMLGSVHRAAIEGDVQVTRQFAAIGVYWPSFQYREDLTLIPTDGSPDAVAAAGLDGDGLDANDLHAYAKNVANDLGASNPESFAKIAMNAVGGGEPADIFANDLRNLLSAASDEAGSAEYEHFPNERGRELHSELKNGGTFTAAAAVEDGDVFGGGASFEALFQRLERLRSGGAAAVARILNQATYYEMKARAGFVGHELHLHRRYMPELLAVSSGDQGFETDSKTSLMLRLAQFELASSGAPADVLANAARALVQAASSSPPQTRFLALGKVLGHPAVPPVLPEWPNLLGLFAESCAGEAESLRLMPGAPTFAKLIQTLFGSALISLRSVTSLASALDRLDKLPPRIRDLILAPVQEW